MASKSGNIYISGVYNMAKTDRKFINRTIKFLIIVGMMIYIDNAIDMTSNINKFIQAVVYNIFGLRTENIDMYMSLYAAIAVLLSSNADLGKKLWYSMGLIIAYITIFIFLIVGRITYPYYSYPTLNLALTLIAFITMAFPILIWVLLEGIKSGIDGVEKETYIKDVRKKNRKKI